MSVLDVTNDATDELDPCSEVGFGLACEKTILELGLYLID